MLPDYSARVTVLDPGIQEVQAWVTGTPLLRPPYAAVPATDTDAGGDDRALYQSYPGEAFYDGALLRLFVQQEAG